MDRLYTVRLTDVCGADVEKLEFDTNITVSIISALNTLRAAGLLQFGNVTVHVASNQVPKPTEVEIEDDPELEHGLSESQILDQMEKLKKWGQGYENWSHQALREKAIEVLQDDIPF